MAGVESNFFFLDYSLIYDSFAEEFQRSRGLEWLQLLLSSVMYELRRNSACGSLLPTALDFHKAN